MRVFLTYIFVSFFSVYRTQNHKVGGRPHNDYNQQMGQVKPEIHQSYQQRTNNQLQAINEILKKSKSALNNLQKNQEHMKVFPEDPPPPPKPAPSNSSNDKKSLKIQLSRLNPEHIEQMGKSVSQFAKNSPESAKKLGVIKDEMDLFSLMKAEDRNLKRKTAVNDVCPCKSNSFEFFFRGIITHFFVQVNFYLYWNTNRCCEQRNVLFFK